MSENATKVAYSITLDNRFPGEESIVSLASGEPRRCHPPIPSIPPSTTAWNSWALPKVTRNLAHQKLEFLNRNFLLFFCLFAALPPPFSTPPPPAFRKDEAPSHLRRAVKRSLLLERTLIRSPSPPRAFCSVDPEWKSAYLPTNEEAWQMSFRFSEHGILNFPIYCAA